MAVPRTTEAAGRMETREAPECGDLKSQATVRALLAKQGKPLGPLPWARRDGEGERWRWAEGRTALLSVAQKGERKGMGKRPLFNDRGDPSISVMR